jgi:hypothetical protein
MKPFVLLIAVTMMSSSALAANRNGVCIKDGKEIRRHAGSCEKQGGRWIPDGASAKPDTSTQAGEAAKKNNATKTKPKPPKPE